MVHTHYYTRTCPFGLLVLTTYIECRLVFRQAEAHGTISVHTCCAQARRFTLAPATTLLSGLPWASVMPNFSTKDVPPLTELRIPAPTLDLSDALTASGGR